MFENRRWLVIPVEEIKNVKFNQIIDNSVDNLRYSIDKTKTFIKYDINIIEEDISNTFINPETMLEETIVIHAGVYGRPSIYKEEYQEYNHQDILVLLSTPEWSSPINV